MAQGVTEDEIASACAQSKAGLLMSLENCASRAEQIARHLVVFGEVLPAEALVARLEAVTAQDVSALMQRLAAEAEATVSIVGPGAPEAAAQRIAAAYGSGR
jgi:predicted Zn-dependent peptidase